MPTTKATAHIREAEKIHSTGIRRSSPQTARIWIRTGNHNNITNLQFIMKGEGKL